MILFMDGALSHLRFSLPTRTTMTSFPQARTRARSSRTLAVAVAVGMATLIWPATSPAQYGGGFGFNRGGYASTAGQGAAYGMSEMMRAQGYQNLQNSEAAKNWQESKTLEMQNRMRWTETYFEMRKTNR